MLPWRVLLRLAPCVLAWLAHVVHTAETGLTHPPTAVLAEGSETKLPPRYLCIFGEYGRSGNKIITIARGLEQAKKDGLQLALDQKWTNWYNAWFEPRDDITLNHICDLQKAASQCRCKSVFAGAMYFDMADDPNWSKKHDRDEVGTNPRGVIPTLCTLKPKQWATTMPSSDVTVHRRWLEGECLPRANKHVVFCGPRNDTYNFNYTCLYTEADIRRTAGVLPGDTVVLYTDGQRRDYDRTFTVVSNASSMSLPQTMVNMARSAKHFGNPMSSMDYILAHWREGPTYPTECFHTLQEQVKAHCAAVTPSSSSTPVVVHDDHRDTKPVACIENLAQGWGGGTIRDDLAAAFVHDTYNKHVAERESPAMLVCNLSSRSAERCSTVVAATSCLHDLWSRCLPQYQHNLRASLFLAGNAAR
jgi:hypothetical protein